MAHRIVGQPIGRLDGVEKVTGASALTFAPSAAADSVFCEWCAGFERQGASPGAIEGLMRWNREIDTRHVLDAIRVPSLVIASSVSRATSSPSSTTRMGGTSGASDCVRYRAGPRDDVRDRCRRVSSGYPRDRMPFRRKRWQSPGDAVHRSTA